MLDRGRNALLQISPREPAVTASYVAGSSRDGVACPFDPMSTPSASGLGDKVFLPLSALLRWLGGSPQHGGIPSPAGPVLLSRHHPSAVEAGVTVDIIATQAALAERARYLIGNPHCERHDITRWSI